MLRKLRSRVYDVLNKSEEGDWLSWFVDLLIVALILLNVAAMIVATEKDFYLRYKNWFDWFELVSVVVFSAEYLLRLWTCVENPKYAHPILGRLRFMFSFFGLVDLLAILPFYLPRFIQVDGRMLRMLRLLRILRVLKIKRYSESVDLIVAVLRERRTELFLSLGIVVTLLLVLSSIMYFIEHEAQPEQFSSIPQTMWWGVATLTTVGYGDIYPITPLGKFIGGAMAILGVGVFALPAGILANGFGEALDKKKKKLKDVQHHRISCPNCGEEIDLDNKHDHGIV